MLVWFSSIVVSPEVSLPKVAEPELNNVAFDLEYSLPIKSSKAVSLSIAFLKVSGGLLWSHFLALSSNFSPINSSKVAIRELLFPLWDLRIFE